MFRQGQLAVHGLAILLGRNEAGISNRGKFFCTTLYIAVPLISNRGESDPLLQNGRKRRLLDSQIPLGTVPK